MKLIERVKLNEGSIPLQAKLGYFRDKKFFKYKCSMGVWTIGYGHAIKPGENFDCGITEEQADAMLVADLGVAQESAKSIHIDKHEEVNDLLAEMVFQLGFSGTKKFKKFIAALKVSDYNEAAAQIIDSNWYRQTPNRVKQHVKTLRSV